MPYPLALGIYETLVENDLTEFDRIVPIPLSPDKGERRRSTAPAFWRKSSRSSSTPT